MATKTAAKATTTSTAKKSSPLDAVVVKTTSTLPKAVTSNSQAYYRAPDGSIKAYGGGTVVPAPSSGSSSSDSTSQNPLPYNTLSNDLSTKNYNDQMSQLETNYNRYVNNSAIYEQQALANKQLNLEGALRQAQVGYQAKGFTGKSGALVKNIQQDTQPAVQDIANTKQNYAIDIENQGVQKQQQETNLSDQQALNQFLKQGVNPLQSFFNAS